VLNAQLRVKYTDYRRAAAVCSLLSRDRCSGHAELIVAVGHN